MDLDGHFRHLCGDDKEMIRQRHGRIEWRLRQAGEEEGSTREKNWGGFSSGTLQTEDDARQNTRQCFLQNDLADRLSACCAEGNAHSAEGLRHGTQGFFRSADDDGQGHDRKREGCGENGRAELQEQNEQS